MAVASFRHKGLRELFETGRSRRVDGRLHRNALHILDHLDGITDIKDCIGVKNFHGLTGARKGTYSMHVTGNWCITFEFDGTDVHDVNLEDYH